MNEIILGVIVLIILILITLFIRSYASAPSKTQSQQSSYTCIQSPSQNAFVPARVNADKSVSCVSNDGVNCIWSDTKEACSNTLEQVNAGEISNTPYTISPSNNFSEWYNDVLKYFGYHADVYQAPI